MILYLLSNLGMGGGSPAAFAGDDVLAAVQAWWQGTPSVQALAADGQLWHRSAPEDTDLPYATAFLVSESPEMWTTAYPWTVSSIQINCHAATDVAARAMALAIRLALGKSPSQPSGAPLAIGTRAVAHVLPSGSGIDVGEGLGPRGRDCWVAFETFDIPWTT